MTQEELKKLIETAPYDFLRTDPRLGKNIVLLGLGGSHAYGTNVEGSDVDLRGITLNSKEEILLGRDFEQIVHSEYDTTIYSIKRIVHLLSQNNPNTLEILFQKPDKYAIRNEIGDMLIGYRKIFLSKKCFYTFGGYATQQLRRLDNKMMREVPQGKQEQHILNSIRNASITFGDKYCKYPEDAIRLSVDASDKEDMESEIFADISLRHYPLRDFTQVIGEMTNIVREYGRIGRRATSAITHNKINKHAMHLIRLLKAAIEILRDGDFHVYCEKDHDLLMSIRNGEYMDENGQMNRAFFEMVDELELEMNNAFQHSELPEKPDAEQIDRLLYMIQESVVCGDRDNS